MLEDILVTNTSSRMLMRSDGGVTRFVRAWVLSLVTLIALWFMTVVLIDMPEAFTLALGGLLLREVAVHFSHARNITLSLLSRIPGAITGKTEYSR